MRDRIRALVAPLLVAAGLALSGCTGASTGTPDAGAAKGYGEQAEQFAADPANGKLIGAVIVTIAVGSLLAWLFRSWAVRIIGALVAGGAVVYLTTKG
jgi:hypothetical protein